VGNAGSWKIADQALLTQRRAGPHSAKTLTAFAVFVFLTGIAVIAGLEDHARIFAGAGGVCQRIAINTALVQGGVATAAVARSQTRKLTPRDLLAGIDAQTIAGTYKV
jgi:hypothetical protein